MLHTVIVSNNCPFPHRSVAFLAGETDIFSSSVKLVCQTLSAVFIPKLDATLMSMYQIRDFITSSVSFTFRENEFAVDKMALLLFQSLSNICIFLCCFFVNFSEIGISPG